jgi:hypothetical protein
VGDAASGRYISHTGNYKLPPLLGLPLAVLCLAILGLLVDRATPLLAASLLLLVGLGIGPIFPIANVAAQNAVGRRDLGAVSGAISFARALGGAVATAAGSALVLGLVLHNLPVADQVGGLTDLMRRDLSAAERLDVAHAFSVFYFCVAGILAIGWVVFARIELRPLHDGRDVQPSQEIA